jgi:hypothetical protein
MAQTPVIAFLNSLINVNTGTPTPGAPNPGVGLFIGNQTTRAGVLGEVSNIVAIGSIYLSTAGKQYLKVANAGANTDWQRVTTTAVD